MAAHMLCTHYGKNADSRSLFEDRKIAQQQEWDKYLNRFDVIRLNMIDFFDRQREYNSEAALSYARTSVKA